jgi:asparagine synthase (glutamine-hydrolysing)
MCGICGIVNLNSSAVNFSGAIKKMTRSMRKRGPDDEGFIFHRFGSPMTLAYGDDTDEKIKARAFNQSHIDNFKDYPADVALGQRRLAILDLSDKGHQPLLSDDNRYAIVFNGEIYNYIELRNELVRCGQIFQSDSDTEVILKSYIVWGESCLRRLNGDFAFSIYDSYKNELFCARDRFGIKPFYYSKDDRFFIFASDITTLLSSGLKSAEIDNDGLLLNMVFGICPRPKTAFKGISALRPGHFLRIDRSGRLEEKAYWRIPIGTARPKMKIDEAVELVEHHLVRSVKTRLASDVAIGTLLSGGVDSTLITAIAALNNPGIQAFTIGYGDRDRELDEVLQARATAAMYDVRHNVTVVDDTDELSDIEAWVSEHEEPYYALSAMNMVARQVGKTGTKVVLSGIGADEIFGGYGCYKYAWIPAFNPANHKSLSILDQNLGWLDGGRISKRLEFLLSSPARRHGMLYRVRSLSDARKFFNKSVFSSSITDPLNYVVDQYCYGSAFSSNVEAFNFMDLTNYLANHHMDRGDKFSMRHSVEARFPFLDHELVEASLTIPSELKVRNNIYKYVLKKVASKYVHRSSLDMSKKGFSLPLDAWARGPLKSLVNDKLKVLAGADLVNRKHVELLQNNFFAGGGNVNDIWHLFSLALWMEKFFKNKI